MGVLLIYLLLIFSVNWFTSNYKLRVSKYNKCTPFICLFLVEIKLVSEIKLV